MALLPSVVRSKRSGLLLISSRSISTPSFKNIYGYREAKPFAMEDYTPEEQANRTANANLFRLVYAYRNYGHLVADLDPLDIQTKPSVLELEPSRYGLPESGVTFNLSGIVHVGKKADPALPREKAPIELIVAHLKKTYCGKIAYEFRHIPNISERRWFATTVESFYRKQLSLDEKRHIFALLTRSEVFDHFMSKRFTQVKRYGLEGAESMMVALDTLFRQSSHNGIIDAVVCMPHRGRLNLLTDLFQYSPTKLFNKVVGKSEFPSDVDATGDVLSHLANSVYLDYGGQRPLHINMLHNPSHLEAVNPVAMGKARAKQLQLLASEAESEECTLGDRVACIQLHGDAAFTGQGVVMETLGLSNLPHFTCGGSIHVVVNNQIGYTTPAMNSRSSIYASDIGKMINAPIIHVNGDHPEDVAYAAALAFEYRHKFRKDVILDLITYRRWGHNELDEPAFTQPLMYNHIRSHKSVPSLYQDKLLAEKAITDEEINTFKQEYLSNLDQHLEAAKTYQPEVDHLQGKWSSMIHPKDLIAKVETGVPDDTLKFIGEKSVAHSDDINIHPRLMKHHVQARLTKLQEGQGIDWATAEALAFGSLLLNGHHVRICGQDVGRGTFSQRHVMFVDQTTEKTVIPLNNLKADQGYLEVANSSLSEMAVMGFEYGMSLSNPNNLNIWEAQFGDFFNGAQIIIDTYLSSGEQKWLRQSGLVLLLPHGYDGAGPEHSSCRVERFLQMTDEPYQVDLRKPRNPNMHIVNPTTPAQYFHLLRRQMVRPYRKPLIVVGPKVLLKSSAAVSTLADMGPGTSFQPVLDDPQFSSSFGDQQPERLVFMSGKLYYDLVKERQRRKLDQQVAIVRLEELAPFPIEELQQLFAKYGSVKDIIWCQEEPQNMGAYSHVEPRLKQMLPSQATLRYIGRKVAAAPATGIGARHKVEQAQLIQNVFE